MSAYNFYKKFNENCKKIKTKVNDSDKVIINKTKFNKYRNSLPLTEVTTANEWF